MQGWVEGTKFGSEPNFFFLGGWGGNIFGVMGFSWG